jgi:hypothetical protein
MRYVLLLVMLMLAGCKVSVETPGFESIRLESPVDLSTQEAQPATPIEEPDVVVPRAPEPPPALPQVKRKAIVQYTIKSCIWCERDRKNVLPNWVKKGWTFDPAKDVIDESANARGAYPRYDIYDENGRKTVHYGSLITLKP